VRHETAAVIAIVLGVSAGFSCSGAPEAGRAPQTSEGDEPHADCAELASVTLTLTPGPGAGGQDVCRVQAKPPRVCVLAGGVVLWRVANGCRKLEAHPGGPPALAIARIHDVATKQPAHWDSAACRLALDVVEAATPAKGNTIVCAVPGDAVPEGASSAVFKYDVEGAEIETLDPDIEVRRP
jgi:hypothetical protein